MRPALLLAALPAIAAAEEAPAPPPGQALPAGLEELNAAEQLLALHLMATSHAIDILSQDMPLAQRTADMQQLTGRMHKLREAYAQVDANELAAAEKTAIANEGVQQLAMQFMALLQHWAARDFDGSAELKAAVFGFLEAENRHGQTTETPAHSGTPAPHS